MAELRRASFRRPVPRSANRMDCRLECLMSGFIANFLPRLSSSVSV